LNDPTAGPIVTGGAWSLQQPFFTIEQVWMAVPIALLKKGCERWRS